MKVTILIKKYLKIIRPFFISGVVLLLGLLPRPSLATQTCSYMGEIACLVSYNGATTTASNCTGTSGPDDDCCCYDPANMPTQTSCADQGCVNQSIKYVWTGSGSNAVQVPTPYCSDSGYEIKGVCCCAKTTLDLKKSGCSWDYALRDDDDSIAICGAGAKEVAANMAFCGEEPENPKKKACCCSVINAVPKKPFVLINPLENLEVKIPGLDIAAGQSATCTDVEGTTQCTLPWLSIYIKGIFNYSMGIMGVLAALAIMIGGIIWLVAGGNASRISESKSWISAGVTGLIIGLTSYMLLNEVNPNLVALKPITISVVKEQIVESLSDSAYSSITGVGKVPPLGKEMKAAIKKVSDSMNTDPCLVVAILSTESLGDVGAIGHDENVWSCDIGSRVAFLTKNKQSCATCHPAPNSPRKNLCPDYAVNSDDWKNGKIDTAYTHGFGVGQATIAPNYDNCKKPGTKISAMGVIDLATQADQVGYTLGGSVGCMSIKDFLTLDGGIKSTIASYYCPETAANKKLASDRGIALIELCFRAYGIGWGGVQSGADKTNALTVQLAANKYASYKKCLDIGFDNISAANH